MKRTKTVDMGIVQLALNAVKTNNDIRNVERAVDSVGHSINDLVSNSNKALMELAKRIQVLESRCEDLEKKVCLTDSPSGDAHTN